MKNISFALLSVFSLILVFASCSKSKTYAEKLADERKAINNFIKKENIKVITFDQFAEQDSTTNLDKNEYVELQNKVYMQIVNKGSECLTDTFANDDKLTVRFVEYSIMKKFETGLTNVDAPFVDAFNYRINGDQISGEFLSKGMMYGNGIAKVPAGWLIAMRFVRKGAHIKVIVPSKMGHVYSLREVYPYHYDLRKIAEAYPGELK